MRGLLMIGGAVLLGLLLFLLVTARQRGESPAVAPTAVVGTPEFPPLPAPMPSDAAPASGLEEPDAQALEEQPRLIETPRPAQRPTPAPATATPDSTRAPSTGATTLAMPISSPPPRYPQRAVQRRETGTVRVQVQVGADGNPVDVSVLESSNSRDLDRAALDAVRRWRFRPAQRDGQAVAGTVVVPIEFKL